MIKGELLVEDRDEETPFTFPNVYRYRVVYSIRDDRSGIRIFTKREISLDHISVSKIFSMLIRVVSRDRFRLVTQRWLVRVCFDHTIYAVYILSWCYFRFTTYSPLIPLVNYF